MACRKKWRFHVFLVLCWQLLLEGVSRVNCVVPTSAAFILLWSEHMILESLLGL